MLDILGVGEFDEEIYRALVSWQVLTRTELAARVREPLDAINQAVDRLHVAGLVTFEGQRVRATDPRVALAHRVKERLDTVHGAWADVEELAGLYTAAELRTGSARLATVIEGDSVTQWFTNLVDSAQHEICLIDAPPHASRVRVSPDDQAKRIEQGVGFRILYAASIFEIPGNLQQVLADVAGGEQARVLSTVPFKLMIVDGTCALLPMDAAAPAASDNVIVVHPSGLLDALIQHFELLWSLGRPVMTGPDGDRAAAGDEPTEEELALLRLFDAGLTDEAVARHLGMSGRTFRRRLTALMERLNVGSRFQAGARARERGWI